MVFFLAFLIGVVAGLRSMMAPAAVCWGARYHKLHLDQGWLSWLGNIWSARIFSALALGELVADKLPMTPSRKAPPGFIARIVSGALCGGAIGTSLSQPIEGMLAGILGSIAGTLGGAEVRSRVVRVIGGTDWPIALAEDLFAIAIAFLVVRSLP